MIHTTPALPEDNSPTYLRPRRTLNRLALALAGAGAAALGQMAFQAGSLWDGLLLYGLGVILFIRALPDHLYPAYTFSLPQPQLDPIFTTYAGWRRNASIWLMMLGLGLSLLGYNFFGQDDTRLQAWWLYFASLLLFIGGAILLTPGASLRAEWQRLLPDRQARLALLLILGLAFLLRLYNFREQPFGVWFDEAEAGLQARRILEDSQYRPVFYPAINVTGHLLGSYALALYALGNSIYAMRTVSVLFGIAGVLAAYLFGRELRGPRFGLALAFLLAVARWHINFSRIAMTGVDAPFFEFLSLFFLVRLFKRGQMRDGLWAGLSLGLGLMFYTAFRLYLMALFLFALVVFLAWWPRVWVVLREGGWRNYGGAMGLLVLSLWLVIMPVVRFANDQPDAFWYRTQQISILTKRDQADLRQALWDSTRKHLLMFNFKGDNNGRHNLPGEPMLDPLTGVLFVLGLGLALIRPHYLANTFFLILLPVTLVGGIFTLDFEAPQSLRSIAVIPAVIYFAALALAALGREAEKALQPLPKGWLWGPASAVATYLLFSNAYTYFGLQGNDFASWNAFSAPETITGRKMAELGPDYVYLLSPFLTNHPSTHFLAPAVQSQQSLRLPDALPVRDPSGRPVALFIHPDDKWIFDQAQSLYPNAHFELLSGPAPADEEAGRVSVYFVELQPADLMSLRGLDLRYQAAGQPEAPPLETSRAFNVNVEWPEEPPFGVDAVAGWNGVLYAPRYGPYTFRLVTSSPAQLEIDGNVALAGQGDQLVALALAQGNHQIRVQADVVPGGQVALYWQPPAEGETLIPAWALYAPPVTNHGLLGSFYPNDNWEGRPALQRVDPFLDTYFHLIPLNRPYTVEWTGALVAPLGGVYRLGLQVVPEAELYLDGQLVLVADTPNRYTEAEVSLEAGLHDLLVRYRDTIDRSQIHLSWVPPNGAPEPIPSQYLWPPMGRYPEDLLAVEVSQEVVPLTLIPITSVGFAGSQPGAFLEPRDVAVMSNWNVVVADTGNKRVQILDPDYNHLRDLSGEDLPFEEPVAVAVNERDEIFVLDATLQWIYHYDAAGNYLGRFAGPEARLFFPRGLAILEDGVIAVADTGGGRVVFFSPEGALLSSQGTLGAAPGQLNEPTDVLRDRQGTYFIVEAENDRLQRLDRAGNPLTQWPIPPAYAHDGPHLALGPDGSLFMTEAQSASLFRYSTSGTLLDSWQIIETIRLVKPVGVYFDPARQRLYVTDAGAHQVHVFGVQAFNPATENQE